ncbi:MAG: diguanylate cyclase [Azonexus sp.]|nr:diguanylate cyclase [Azonexus sp.]
MRKNGLRCCIWLATVSADAKKSHTPSIGVALLAEHETSYECLLQRVDEALYRAKENGRDQVASEQAISGG